MALPVGPCRVSAEAACDSGMTAASTALAVVRCNPTLAQGPLSSPST